ncbi:hypothetical protein BKA67DRAFT_568831 [Truncatella angustata]|uniref:F-box domain-containing protein n=1 Tax=Truncatella angustata TaxID=152316 RepID=A0A9P8ZXM7_9PEZI|nr:uncharacterized protein BKA67DRAFT_568831 [Truncatella angustata]KAH6653193.1 hypothetical protein BKA67DRAFT_568831 [Truncatella angustata]KAH8196759.1 hypothetical protein TruAng_009078 [Truncatella angustata]
MGSFTDLSFELQELILTQLLDNPQMPAAFLCNANLVCHQWHEIATRLLFQDITLVAAHRSRKQKAYIDHLISNKRISEAIRNVSIVITRGLITVTFLESLEKLVPLLVHLRKIEIIGDSNVLLHRDEDNDDETDDYIHINELRKAIPEILGKLERRVSIHLDRYVHTLDVSSLDLSYMTSSLSTRKDGGHALKALSASLLQSSSEDGYYPSLKTRYPACASQEVAALLKINEELESLTLEMSIMAEWTYLKENYEEEKQWALENIVPTYHPLTSLSLHGHLVMSDKAWGDWKSFRWSQLTSLTIGHPKLLESLTLRLEDVPLSSLQTLKVFNYKSVESIEDCLTEPPGMGRFLRSTTVNELCLVAIKPNTLIDFLAAGRHAASVLEKLRFHHPNPNFVLSMTQITELKGLLVNVSWLGLDMHRRHLFGTSHPDAHLLYLDAVAEMRALKHLRVFLHDEPFLLDRMAETEFTKADAIASFRYLDVQKQGSALESLVICQGRGFFSELWIVWHLGGSKVMLDHRHAETGRRVETWDLDILSKVKEYPARWTEWGTPSSEWRCDPLWGFPEGW